VKVSACLGLDVGGANLKIAHSDGIVRTVPFALWRAPDELGPHLRALLAEVPAFDRLGVTMTGELCDCFASKREGVRHIVACVAAEAGSRDVGVWALPGRFVTPEEAMATPAACAAANWHALATCLLEKVRGHSVLLVDIGSTTTDIIPLIDGAVAATGRNDTERLASGELVYLGVGRTPVATLGPAVAWKGRCYGLMAESFATTADLFLLAGHDAVAAACTDTCDGRPMTQEDAARRILRMIGADFEVFSLDDARSLAQTLAATCTRRVAGAVRRVTGENPPSVVVVSGSGDHLGIDAAMKALPACRCVRLADWVGRDASDAATAWALAHLGITAGNVTASPIA